MCRATIHPGSGHTLGRERKDHTHRLYRLADPTAAFGGETFPFLVGLVSPLANSSSSGSGSNTAELTGGGHLRFAITSKT